MKTILKRIRNKLLKFTGASSPAFSGKLHGYTVSLNPGNIYPQIAADTPLFNACLVETVHYLHEQLKRAISVIDVGAACGDTVLLLEQRCKACVAEYLCVEGDDEFSHYLKRNLAQFPHVRIAKEMLAGEKCMIQKLVKHHPGTAGCFGKEQVEARPLDDVFDQLFTKVDLIKIDVDGFDGEVLRGSKKILETQKPTVVFEWHPLLYQRAGNDWHQPFAVLEAAGYCDFLWFLNDGEFSHFSSKNEFSVTEALGHFLVRTNHRFDRHYDVVALSPNIDQSGHEVALLNRARDRYIKYPVC